MVSPGSTSNSMTITSSITNVGNANILNSHVCLLRAGAV
jgi:hypothetical protein